MKIDSFDINMQSSSSYIFEHESTQKVTVHKNSNTSNTSQNISLSMSNYSSTKIVYNDEEQLDTKDKIKKQIIERLLEALTNKKNKIKLYPNNENEHLKQKTNYYPQNSNSNNNSWGFTFESSEEYYQKSEISFSANAIIKTANSEININLDINFSQEFYESRNTRISFGEQQLQDPLVINLNENANLDLINKNMKFLFDINSDGNKEEISLLNQNIGFLALDKNYNGQIDNGSELFGTKSGNGFSELSQYDNDKNNWIDENDSIFNNLRVWQVNENGEGNLITLGEANVGAIYLSSVSSDFTYSSSIEQDNAKLKETSIYLKESDGSAGVISSIDFKI